MSLKPNDIDSAAGETEALRRWSRTKLENCAADGTRKNVPSENCDKVLMSDEYSGEAPKIDRDFGKLLTTAALKKLFQKPEFSVLDGLNEYDDDFTYFAPRGDVITREMQRAVGEIGDRIANADMKADDQVAELHDDQLNSTFSSGNNAKSPEHEGEGGKA